MDRLALNSFFLTIQNAVITTVSCSCSKELTLSYVLKFRINSVFKRIILDIILFFYFVSEFELSGETIAYSILKA